MKKLFIWLIILAFAFNGYCGDVTRAHTFVDAEVLTAALLNGEIDPIVTALNDIVGENLASDIAITTTGNAAFSGSFAATGTALSLGNGGSDALTLNCAGGITYTPAATWTFTGNQTVSGTWADLGVVTTVDVATITASALTIDGNWTATGQTCADLGTVTTADLETVTLGNATFDGGWTATGQTCADLGTVTTTGAITTGGKLTAGANEIEGSNFDINGGTIDGVTSISSGTFTATTGFSAASGAVGAPGFFFTSDTDTGAYLSATGQFSISAAGGERMQFAAGGATIMTDLDPSADNSIALGGAGARYTTLYSVALNTGDIKFANGWVLREYPSTAEDAGKPISWYEENANQGMQFVDDDGNVVAVFHKNGNLYINGTVMSLDDL